MSNVIVKLEPEEIAPNPIWVSYLESGQVLFFPKTSFALHSSELNLLNPALTDAKSKNISLNPSNQVLQGVTNESGCQAQIKGLMERYFDFSLTLIDTLFPSYQARLTLGPTSLRLHQVQNRKSSWRKDDSRLHVDAFPSRPNHGKRILRVFTNIHPQNEPRVWRVGEPFERVSERFLKRIPKYWPGFASLLKMCHITKSYRSEYDHIMLHLHDQMKKDEHYQAESLQQTVAFAPGSTWICFSDQTLHAAMSGQFMLEQTFWLPIDGMVEPKKSPLKVLEQQTGRRLIPR